MHILPRLSSFKREAPLHLVLNNIPRDRWKALRPLKTSGNFDREEEGMTCLGCGSSEREGTKHTVICKLL